MNYLTMEEKVYLIKGFFSREKVYVNAYRAFRTRCGTHRVANESTLKKLEKLIYSYSLVTEEAENGMEEYFTENPNSSIRKTARARNLGQEKLSTFVNVISTPTESNNVKSLIYETPVLGEEDLLARVMAACEHVQTIPGIFHRIRESMNRRCHLCIEENSQQFEHLL
ncbi:hypothetical protein X777_06631 [Ooceraea biroi]|uniref:DUF4817 domain-containing protein n=1 Tax=Ooceraea biroi TaxID=2015173 RepID=A0A026WCL4_OOCBI|nr:hypothetical protein X777_06631 [Ooceraea biroi]